LRPGIDRDHVVAKPREHFRRKPRTGAEIEHSIPGPAVEHQQHRGELEETCESDIVRGNAQRKEPMLEWIASFQTPRGGPAEETMPP
jgi:hypothetical protein